LCILAGGGVGVIAVGVVGVIDDGFLGEYSKVVGHWLTVIATYSKDVDGREKFCR